MKKLSGLLFIALLLMATTAFASSSKVKKELMEDNLIAGLQFDNLGLKTSSAYLLGEYGSSKCINSLLKVLKSGKKEKRKELALQFHFTKLILKRACLQLNKEPSLMIAKG